MTEEPVLAAGGVVLRDGAQGREVLLVHKVCPAEWRLPKGKIRADEAAAAAALREVFEEAGTPAQIVAELGVTEHEFCDPQTGRARRKQTRYFLMRPTGPSVPPLDARFDQALWVPAEQALHQLTFASERAMVRRALALAGREG
jgi:8-oxo-dGTP pyrophosphatase MutT (NUDIX family)